MSFYQNIWCQYWGCDDKMNYKWNIFQIKMDSEEDDVKNFIEDINKTDYSPDYKAPILLVTTEW